MRVHSLVFLASSALSARGDGALEPVDPNVAVPYSASGARSLTENDDNNDAPAMIPSENEGLVNDDERMITGLAPVSSWVGKVRDGVQTAVQGGKQKAFDSLAQKAVGTSVTAEIIDVLKSKECTALYALYKRSGKSMITPLLARYGDAEVARALSAALKFDSARVLQLPKEPKSIQEKLVVDLLEHWKAEDKNLDAVFKDLMLDRQLEEGFSFFWKFQGKRIRIFEAYRQFAGRSDFEYLDAIKTGFGGEKRFWEQLDMVKRGSIFTGMAKELADIALRKCLADGVDPVAVVKKMWPNPRLGFMFDEHVYLQVGKYVDAYNNANPAEKTTVLQVTMDILGGEVAFLQELKNISKKTYAVKATLEHALFKQWRNVEKIKHVALLRERLKDLDENDRKVIESMYDTFLIRYRASK